MPQETKDRVNRPVDWLNKFALAAAARGLYVKVDSDNEIETVWVQPFFVDVNNTQVLNGTLAYLRDITNQNDTARILPNPASVIADTLPGLLTNDRATYFSQVFSGNWLPYMTCVAKRSVSAVHTAKTTDLFSATTAPKYTDEPFSKTLDIHMTCSAGTATVTVEVSVDTVNWLTIDSIAAAATTIKHYDATVVGGTTAICPLGFPYIRVTAGDAGVGNTTTTTVVIK